MAKKPRLRITHDGGNRRVIVERFRNGAIDERLKPVQKLVIDNHDDALAIINALASYLGSTDDPEDDQDWDNWTLPLDEV